MVAARTLVPKAAPRHVPRVSLKSTPRSTFAAPLQVLEALGPYHQVASCSRLDYAGY